MERMDTDTHVESIFTSILGNVLVGTDATCFQCFSRKLLVFVGDKMDAEWIGINGCLLFTQVVDSKLGVGYTTAVSALGVRLVLTIAVATSGTAAHDFCQCRIQKIRA